ncbi:MAG: hypothetical protein GEU28_14535 [Dehalococcoidia bacterium]|nr:hypothetical protein [Dehalococcoidia bacterium]
MNITVITPKLSIDDVTVTEGDTGMTPATFTVSLSSPAATEVRVDFTTADYPMADDAATSQGPYPDYLPDSGTVVFGPRETSQTIIIDVVGDLVDEQDESFTVMLSNPVNGRSSTMTWRRSALTTSPLPRATRACRPPRPPSSRCP